MKNLELDVQNRNCPRYHCMVLDDCRVRVCQKADILSISNDIVHGILTEELEMRKYSARWVPPVLPPEQKLNCVFLAI